MTTSDRHTDRPLGLYGRPQPANEEDAAEQLGDEEPRCQQCNKLLAILVTRPWRIRCVRCKAENSKP